MRARLLQTRVFDIDHNLIGTWSSNITPTWEIKDGRWFVERYGDGHCATLIIVDGLPADPLEFLEFVPWRKKRVLS